MENKNKFITRLTYIKPQCNTKIYSVKCKRINFEQDGADPDV